MLWWAFLTLLIQYSPYPFPPQPELGPAQNEAWVSLASQRQSLNLLQEVGGEQPHLAAGVDLDVATSFISFLYYDLVG